LFGLFNLRHSLNEHLESFGGHVGYCLRPIARGHGVATELLRAATAFGCELGIDSLVLTCDTTNHLSIRVIEKNGGNLRDTYFHESASGQIHRFDLPTAGN
jgi:predicted acetyltransferase